MKPSVRHWLLVAGFAVVVILILLVLHVASERVVAEATTPDGGTFLVLQGFAAGDFFNTRCLFQRRPGARWQWFYYNHEDWYWRRGRTEVDAEAKQIRVYRGGALTAQFDWETGNYWRANDEGELHLWQSGEPTWVP